MTNQQPPPRPREGDICRTSDGHLWRVTSTHDRGRVAAVSRLGDHIEMAVPYDDVEIVEAHPGGKGGAR